MDTEALIEEVVQYVDDLEATRYEELEAAFVTGYLAGRNRGRLTVDPDDITARAAKGRFKVWISGWE